MNTQTKITLLIILVLVIGVAMVTAVHFGFGAMVVESHSWQIAGEACSSSCTNLISG